MNKIFKMILFVAILGIAPMTWACDDDDGWEDYPVAGSIPDDNKVANAIYGDNSASEKMTDLTAGVTSITLVDPNQARGGNSQSNKSYLNNVDSAKENRNKMRINAASQAISLGQHAVALALESKADIDALQEEIEGRDDVLRMLKGNAKLQAQNLQKTNAITAMRAKLTELSALENIISGDVYTTQKSSGK